MFSFSEIVGHEQIKEHMQAAIRDKKPFHAYLFQGEEGVGKEQFGVLKKELWSARGGKKKD